MQRFRGLSLALFHHRPISQAPVPLYCPLTNQPWDFRLSYSLPESTSSRQLYGSHACLFQMSAL